MKKIIRVTTADISLDILLKGQLRYLNNYYEVVGVAADTGVLQKVAEREGIRTIAIPMHREISLLSDWKCLWQLVRLFKKEKPDIVHTNTPKGSLLSMMAAKIAGVPHRIYLVTGLRYKGTTGLFRWLLMTMERISCWCATKVIPEGNGVKAILQHDHITRKPLMLIHNGNINGIDTDYFSPDQVKVKRSEIFTFIFIGRIVGDKGMNELAEAIHQLRNDGKQFRVILVGNFETELDPLQGDNETFLRTAEEVEYVGYQQDVRPYLAMAIYCQRVLYHCRNLRRDGLSGICDEDGLDFYGQVSLNGAYRHYHRYDCQHLLQERGTDNCRQLYRRLGLCWPDG